MQKRCKSIAAIAGFLALFGFLAFQIGVASKYPNRPQQQQTTTNASESTQSEPLLDVWWQWTTHDPTAFYTSVLTLFTGLLFVSTVGLWVVTYLALRHSRETAERQLRAYIFVTQIYRIDTPNRLYFCAEMITRNTGQTPAYEVRDRQIIDADFFPRQKPFANWKDEGGETVRLSMSPIGPGHHHESRLFLKRNLDEDELRFIENGTAAVWVYGEISYMDAFGNNRTTRYRLHSIGEGFKRGRFIYDAEGNDPD